MRSVPVTSVALLLVASLIATACDDGGGETTWEECTYESCLAHCLEIFADDLESCGGICNVESFCLTSGQCKCSFYPCHEETCREWCLDNEDLDNGGCGAVSGNFLSCDCW